MDVGGNSRKRGRDDDGDEATPPRMLRRLGGPRGLHPNAFSVATNPFRAGSVSVALDDASLRSIFDEKHVGSVLAGFLSDLDMARVSQVAPGAFTRTLRRRRALHRFRMLVRRIKTIDTIHRRLAAGDHAAWYPGVRFVLFNADENAKPTCGKLFGMLNEFWNKNRHRFDEATTSSQIDRIDGKWSPNWLYAHVGRMSWVPQDTSACAERLAIFHAHIDAWEAGGHLSAEHAAEVRAFEQSLRHDFRDVKVGIQLRGPVLGGAFKYQLYAPPFPGTVCYNDLERTIAPTELRAAIAKIILAGFVSVEDDDLNYRQIEGL
jgi:hypothetical protein